MRVAAGEDAESGGRHFRYSCPDGGNRLPYRDFESIYSAHARLVYWAAYGVTREHNHALDVAQTVFLRVFKHLSKLEDMDDGQLRAWLYRVSVNAAKDLLRKERRLIPSEDVGLMMGVSEAELPESLLLSQEARERVKAGVSRLPEIYREPILLYYFSELDYRQIAEVLDVNEGTLKSRMSRARKMLYEILGREGEALEQY